ncbi:GntR family transcriptional regulator [Nocardioides insulae]|uniref:GntR family transcriptional regulator n=1 Tax=Nocardioides insulae TaxID=394734 RepID=UPI00048D4908|nr:GntR family transcriptional regulator [Nocardioides insulae]
MADAHLGGPRPKHVRVREALRELLDEASPGTPLPSERDLVERFGVARMTVRQALDALVSEGLVERIPGRGSFAASRGPLNRVVGLTEELGRIGQMVETRTVLARREQAGPGVARALELSHGEAVVHWRRLRLTDGEPLCLEDVFLPARLVETLTRALPASLYAWLGARQLRPTRVEDHWTADHAGALEAVHLGTRETMPVLRKRRRGLCDGQVIEVSQSVFRGDRYALRLSLEDR